MDIKKYVTDRALEARAGARSLAKATTDQKNRALIKMAKALKKRSMELITANKKDIA